MVIRARVDTVCTVHSENEILNLHVKIRGRVTTNSAKKYRTNSLILMIFEAATEAKIRSHAVSKVATKVSKQRSASFFNQETQTTSSLESGGEDTEPIRMF